MSSYKGAMRSIACTILLLVACSGADKGPDHSRIPKKPNNELIVGVFERHPPAGTSAFKFETDGTFTVAKTKAELDRTPHLMEGKYTVEADKLSFETVRGECAGDHAKGSYKVVISKVGIRVLEKIEDACEWRGRLVGQTLWRVK
jgi:hypothetical protein